MDSNQQKLKPLKLVPVPRLLDHIGLAMYSKFIKAIGELVVNGYDADATRVDVDIRSGEIIIEDNGSGMDEEGIREGYMLLGADTKRKIKKTFNIKEVYLCIFLERGREKITSKHWKEIFKIIRRKNNHNKYLLSSVQFIDLLKAEL